MLYCILYYLGGLDQGLLGCNHFNGLIRFQKEKKIMKIKSIRQCLSKQKFVNNVLTQSKRVK